MNTLELFKLRQFDIQIFADDSGSEGAPAEDVEANEGHEDDGAPEPFSEAQQRKVDELVNKRVERALRAQEKRLADEKKKEETAQEAKRLKTMTAQEKKDRELQNALSELEKLKQANHRNEMMATARSVIQESGHSFSDTIISGLIRDDADTTKECIDDFIDEFDKAVKAEVKKKTNVTAPKAGKKPSSITRADIMAITDTKERQRMIGENMHLFR